MLHIYYGTGKGKTSALNGSAIRAKGAGLNVIVFRFLKGMQTSEDSQLQELNIITYKTQTSEKFIVQMDETEKQKTKEELKLSLNDLKKVFEQFDMIILDEFLDLSEVNVGLMTQEEQVEFLKLFKDKEVLISGHNKKDEIFKLADLITKFDAEKHYYDKDVKARKGIEY